ncbi:hypothetical protein [Saccharospirillum salsuginis]|uniref:Uncharacterized protein n=1 Tax=Saccharospirillum salsuginis TaxID=418750 RepID=A0A918K8P0_9GAMM|nr:hypothetical protein [Saccharospirillum salsuginis]GGX54991.1 hypothetical protein GCM10007392_23180 [Saccharospirillum salsuginis]
MPFKKSFLWVLALCVGAAVVWLRVSTVSDINPTDEATTAVGENDRKDNSKVTQARVQAVEPENDTGPEQGGEPDQATSEATESSWITLGTTSLSAQLYDFIETEKLKYVDIGGYPFDDYTDNTLRQLAQSGDVLLFDNTDAYRLEGLEEEPADIVADYFGTAAEADAVIATSRTNAEGGIHYMVLPVNKSGDDKAFYADIKRAVTLLKDERDNKAQR